MFEEWPLLSATIPPCSCFKEYRRLRLISMTFSSLVLVWIGMTVITVERQRDYSMQDSNLNTINVRCFGHRIRKEFTQHKKHSGRYMQHLFQEMCRNCLDHLRCSHFALTYVVKNGFKHKTNGRAISDFLMLENLLKLRVYGHHRSQTVAWITEIRLCCVTRSTWYGWGGTVLFHWFLSSYRYQLLYKIGQRDSECRWYASLFLVEDNVTQLPCSEEEHLSQNKVTVSAVNIPVTVKC